MNRQVNKKSIPKDKQKPAETKRKQPSRRSDFNEKSWLKYLLAGVVLLITWYTFHPALKNQITNWDDNVYLMDNLMMQKPFFVAANYFFTHFYGSNYFPFPMITYCLEWNAQKFNPEIYHLVNILFHLLNVVLVFWFIYLLSEKKLEVAVVVAVLFGIHPMHVESVAWIAELKDVEYSFFFLLGLISYYKYIRGISEKKVVLIVLAFVFFICSISLLNFKNPSGKFSAAEINRAIDFTSLFFSCLTI